MPSIRKSFPRLATLAALIFVCLGARPFVPLGLSLASSSVVGGSFVIATITLSTPAPAGGLVVVVTSFPGTTVQPDGAPVGLQPVGGTRITIAQGARTAIFRVNTPSVASLTEARVTATSGTDVSSATLTILPPSVQSVTATPATMVSGSSSTGKVTLNGLAPAQGFVVPIFASNASVVVPSSVTVSGGNREQTFPITSSPTAVGSSVIISTRRVREAASRNADGTSNTIVVGEPISSGIASALTLLPAPVIASFTLRPNQVKGGHDVTAEIQLIAVVTSAQTVRFSTDKPDVVQLPASISVPVSSTPTSLTITTHDVTEKVTATITATAGSQSIPVVLTIKK